MKCEEVRRYLSPYLDSELDPKTSFEMDRHLEECAGCLLRLESEGIVEKSIVEELRRPEPGDEELWRRAMSRARPPSRRVWAWAAVLLVAVGLAAGIAWRTSRETGSLAAELRKDYEKYRSGHSHLDVASSNPRDLEGFFRERMGLAVRIPTLPELALEGGRKCSLRGAPTAFIVFRVPGKGPVSMCVFNADQLDRFPDAGLLNEPLAHDGNGVQVVALRSGWKVITASGPLPCGRLLELCKMFEEPTDRPR